MRIVECIRSWIDLEEGEVFGVLKEYWYNGETWYKLRDGHGITHKFPSVFFDDFIPSADPTRSAYYSEDDIVNNIMMAVEA